jgi:hypothetical protein
MRQVYEFDKDFYETIPYELFEEWYEAFSSGFLCAFRGKEPVAVLGLFPTTPRWVEGFLSGKVDEVDLSGKIIRASDGTYWYISGLSSIIGERNLRSHLPRILGFALLRWLRNNAAELNGRRLCLVAEGATDEGVELLDTIFDFTLKSGGLEPGGSEKSGQKPRFSRVTDVPEIMSVLTNSPFFQRSPDLQQEINAVRVHLERLHCK